LSIAIATACYAVPTFGQGEMQDQMGGKKVVLPDGNGKASVEAACQLCHTLNNIANASLDRKGWNNLVDMMMNAGAPVPKDQVAIVKDYLATNFPEKPTPPAVIVPGSAEATFKTFALPISGTRPHDPLVAGGYLWYAGQFANVIGRINAKTGEIKQYKMKTAYSGPHALIADKSGKIWFTANFAGYIGKLDPETGDITEYHMPNPKARDPHTLIMDQHGTIWFTVQGGNFVGRLMPSTGDITLVPVPTPRARPYGMTVNSKGIVYFVEFGTNKIGSIDPETLAIHEYDLPNPASRPRRITVTADDMLWYGDYSRGYLGRLDPTTGKVDEWPSPGGPKSLPYGITVVHGAIWYSESGVKPNTMVRFDPKTQKFQTWAIPDGGDVVRNMVTTPHGNNIVISCSGANDIALVEIKDGTPTAGE
jgi:virginiamycin B lyase